MDIRYDIPSTTEYMSLRLKTNMGPKNLERVQLALKNSLFLVSLWEGETLIGLGRVVGDAGITYIVSDIMVDPAHQHKGYGKVIMHEIDVYLNQHTDEHAYVCLIANNPADKLYEQFGFAYVTPKACGMKRIQSK
jgi:GNAT superfamily N-acetyltransferase